MMIASTATDIVLIIGVTTTSVISIIGAWYGRGTKQELKTFNDQSVGQQISASTSARYVQIPIGDRTDAQVRHLLDVPPDGVPVPVVAIEGNPAPPAPPPQ